MQNAAGTTWVKHSRPLNTHAASQAYKSHYRVAMYSVLKVDDKRRPLVPLPVLCAPRVFGVVCMGFWDQATWSRRWEAHGHCPTSQPHVTFTFPSLSACKSILYLFRKDAGQMRGNEQDNI